MEIVYLDNAATTRISDVAAAEIERAEKQLFYNSAALYAPSLLVKNEIAGANALIKKRLTRESGGDLIFTSGATEANNMVIFGKITNVRQHVLALAGEHSSVYAPLIHLKNQGNEVDFIPLLSGGRADLTELRRLVKPNTALVVFGLVNSDTGTIQDAAEIVRIARSVNNNVHIHCDAVQGFCKLHFDAAALGLDSCSVSAHKINGPKGIGALWVRKGATLQPIMYGGSQQDLRPGTENNPAILGFAKAVESFNTEENFRAVKKLHNHLIAGLPPSCTVNGENTNPYITNIQLPGILGNTVLNAMSNVGICVGLGSACASKASKNRTLLAMGISEQKTKQVLRVSLGVYNTFDDIDRFLTELKRILAQY